MNDNIIVGIIFIYLCLLAVLVVLDSVMMNEIEIKVSCYDSHDNKIEGVRCTERIKCNSMLNKYLFDDFRCPSRNMEASSK